MRPVRATAILAALLVAGSALVLATPMVEAAPPCAVGYSWDCIVHIECVMKCCEPGKPCCWPECYPE